MNKQAQTTIPLHEHGAFYDVQAAVSFIGLAKDAMLGIGALLQPETSKGDEQLNGAHRSEVAAIFRFFGEALHEPVETAYDANDRFQAELRNNYRQSVTPAQPGQETIDVTRHPGGIVTF